MWIKTQAGNLCNLGRATDVMVVREPLTKKFLVQAWFADESMSGGGEVEAGHTTLAGFDSEADASQYMKGLGMVVGAKLCVLNKN